MEIPNRTDYDAAFARKLARLNNRHRCELIAYLGHPPNVANVPAEFWERVRQENEAEIAAALLLLFGESFSFHAEAAGADRARLSAAGIDAAERYATEKSREVATAMAAGARERIERLAHEKWNTARAAADEALTKAEIAADIAKTWGPTGAAATAVTETTAAQTAGGEAAINRTVGISDDDAWRIHPELSATGTCPTCRPLDGRPRRIWSVEFPAGPPAHRNCNCEIIYAGIGVAASLTK